jgi:HSP20 family protein
MVQAMSSYPNSLFDQFDRLQREIAGAFGFEGVPSGIRSVAAGTLPAINVGRTPTSVEVYAFAPGLDASKVDVTLDRGVLRISGERETSLPGADARVQVYARERIAGRFARALSLPDDVDPAKVNASYRDGVLRVSVGLRESAKPQRIAVQ